MKYLILILLAIGLTQAKLADDLITFPEWPSDYTEDFQVYSGQLDVTDGKAHYVFLERDQANVVPSEEPIVLWLQGGQGCSSLLGLMQEVGPYLMSFPSERFPATKAGANQYAWNKLANMLFIEAPLKTGFSTFSGAIDYAFGDVSTAVEVYDALKYFFSQNPEFNESKFIIAGEGLAGQVIPLVAEKIVAGNEGKKVGDSGYINLTSLLMGNAMLEENSNSDFWEHYHSLETLDYHGLFGPQMDELWYRCVYDSLTNPGCEYFQEKSEFIRTQLNPWNLNAKCQNRVADPNETGEDITENAYCLDWSAIEKFFSKESTKSAFNLGDFNPDHDWQMCNMGTEINYEPVEGGTKETVVTLIKDHGINVTMYTGLNDSTVPYMTSQQYLKDIARETKAEQLYELEPWLTNEGQIGGWTEAYENFQLVKVRAAGHQVPADQPSAAYTILSKTIRGEPVV